ncbi:MAG: glycosyltransferase family 2 protein [Alistipes sp.]|jgi:hypothetical protein|nr:glycosyltransferase family 2 protein [Alistipes sp.]
MKFSVIIPLYNKEAEIERTLRSALAQTLPPLEIVVVDDGSTDRSAAIVEAVMAEISGKETAAAETVREKGEGGAESIEAAACERGENAPEKTPQIKLIRQKNAGETAARNRAMAEASGDYFALVDADDEWRDGFLAEIASLIAEHPDCGLYSTGFDIVNTDGTHPANTIRERGVVDDFFRASMTAYVSIPSASVIPRYTVEAVGGFPEGMRMGGDQYMWTKIARRFKVCFSPERLVRYYMAASNRSAAIYKPEVTDFSFEDFYVPMGTGCAADVIAGRGANGRPEADKQPETGKQPETDKQPESACRGGTLGECLLVDHRLNEYIARVALGKALVLSAKGGTADGLRAERFFAYNRGSRRLWWRLWILNRLPRAWRPRLHALYTDLAWRLARKGL